MVSLGSLRPHKSTNVRSLTVAAAILAALAVSPPVFAEGQLALTADAALREGAAAAARGHWAAARRAFEDAVQIDPRIAAAHFNLGVALAALGESGAAVRAYRDAIRRAPDFTEAFVNLGVELSKLGKPGEAVPYLLRAVRLSPALAAAHHNLGIVLAELGDLDAAIESLDRARALAPHDDTIRRTLADAQYNAGVTLARQRRWTDAIDRYRRALDADADLPEAFNGLGVALAGMHQHEAALAMYAEALRLRPAFADARYNLAISQAALGRRADAIASCHATLEARPTLWQARQLLDRLERDAATRGAHHDWAPPTDDAAGPWSFYISGANSVSGPTLVSREASALRCWASKTRLRPGGLKVGHPGELQGPTLREPAAAGDAEWITLTCR